MINSIKMDKTNSLEKKEITINSSVENLAYVEQEIEAIFDEFGISFDLFGNVLIAVTEAVTNAISYGNRNDVTKQVTIHFENNPSRLRVSVSDEGQGFDYELLPDPTDPENIEKLEGRGIFLMKSLSDGLSFYNEGSKVEMTFKY
jgi:serine/threonine-protein kinase RsbW